MSKGTSRATIFILTVLLLISGMFIAISAQRPNQPAAAALAFTPGLVVHGDTYAGWNARHWQWTVSVPIPANPGYDVTGTKCSIGQSGPVFFLPRNFAPCTVPAEMAVLVPVTGNECSTREPAPFSGTNEEELRACAAREVERYTNVYVTVDGETIPDIGSYRTTSPLFALSLPEQNILGAPAGVAYAVADGYQVILRPMAPGKHEIIVHLELVDGTVLPDKRTVITVVEPGWSPPIATPGTSSPTATPASWQAANAYT